LYKIVSTLEGFGYTLMTFTSSPWIYTKNNPNAKDIMKYGKLI
jgi:hypothetical protein